MGCDDQRDIQSRAYETLNRMRTDAESKRQARRPKHLPVAHLVAVAEPPYMIGDKWVASIEIPGESLIVKSFSTEEEALEWRRERLDALRGSR